jgi:hypothetical protein
LFIYVHNTTYIFSRSVFGVGGSKKVISEEIIETVEDTHATSAPDPPKKIARMSYDPSAKSGTQVCVFIVSCFILWCFGSRRGTSRGGWRKVYNGGLMIVLSCYLIFLK